MSEYFEKLLKGKAEELIKKKEALKKEALKKEAANIGGRALARQMIGAEPNPAEFMKDAFEIKEISDRLDEMLKAEKEKAENKTEGETQN